MIDGEILGGCRRTPRAPLPTCKAPGPQDADPKLLRELPVVLVAYDLLEHAGHDVRERPSKPGVRIWRPAAAVPPPPSAEPEFALRLSPLLQGR